MNLLAAHKAGYASWRTIIKLPSFQALSIKTRVTLGTLGIFLLSLWLLAFYASLILHADMERVMGEQQFSTVSIVAAQINTALEEHLTSLERHAGGRIPPPMLGNAVALQARLQESPIIQGLFNAGVFVTDAHGTAIASVPVSVGRVPANYMDRDYIVAALKDGKSTIGKPVIGKKLQAPVFAMAVSIRDPQGKIIGVLVGVTDLAQSNFLDGISQGHYGRTGNLIIIAPQYRRIITGSDKRRVMEELPAPGMNPPIDRRVRGQEGSEIFINPSGVEVLISSKNIPVAGWVVTASLPTQEAFAPIREVQQRLLLVTILMTLLAGALTWWLVQRQLAPMLVTVKTLATLSRSNQPPAPLPITRQDEIGDLIGGFNHLLSELGQREETLRESERQLRESQDIARLGSYVIDMATGLWKSSETLDSLFGIDARYVRSLAGWLALVHPDDRFMIDSYFKDYVLGQNQFFDKPYRIVRHDDQTLRWVHGLGKREFDADGGLLKMFGTIQDITERKQMEDQIRQLAFYDPLTELPNRRLLGDRLTQAMATSKRSGRYGALMFLDLDNFKALNDTHGHAAGDLLLMQAARRMKSCVREVDTVARLGGDEFVVLLSDLDTDKAASTLQVDRIAEKIRATLAEPYTLTIKHEGKADAVIEHQCTASIGVVVFIDNEGSPEDFLRWADSAMYRAKDAGCNLIRFHAAGASHQPSKST
jgi:diguanylate cyclase (GGDEF)-like protein/PAS domain S-box-containing protein